MNIRTFLLLSLLAPIASLAQIPYPGNDAGHGVTELGFTPDGFPNPYAGNVSFFTRDITVAGAVGQHGLTWQRFGTSRTSQAQDLFGLGHNWTHNWQWEMVAEGKDSQNRSVISVREPRGAVYRYVETSPGQWWSTPDVTDRVVSSGAVFTVQRRGGNEVRFVRRGGEFTLQELTDGQGNVWKLTYSDNKLVRVSEPAGRWLKIKYKNLSQPGAASGTPPYTVIAGVTASDGQSVTYSYEFQEGADYPVLVEAAYPDDLQASYTYGQFQPGARVLLTQANDPHADPYLRSRVLAYRSEVGAAAGQFLEARARDTNAVMFALSADAKDPRGYAITQPDGSTTYQTFNPGGNVRERVDALGFSTTFEYSEDGRGLLTSTSDALGNATRYEHSPAGDVAKVIHPDKHSRSWKHDDKGRVTAETDELGAKRTYTFDSRGRVVRTVDTNGAAEAASYNAFGQLVAHRDRNGNTRKFAYDDRGLRRSTSNGLGNTTSLRYDRFDNLAEVTDANGITTKLKHDLRGRLREIAYVDGVVETLKYSDYGDLLESGAMGCASCFAQSYLYDSFGRRIQATDAAGNVTKWEYAPIGGGAPFNQFVRAVSPAGNVTQVGFDANGRVIARTAAAGTSEAATTRYSYDAAGRQTNVIDAGGRSLQLFYDSRGRVIKAMGAMNNATTFSYDATGRKISETDAKGNTTKWTYDGEGRELTRVDAAKQVTRRQYDGLGNLIALTDAKDSTTRFQYDVVGHRTAIIYPDGSEETTTYDEVGNEKTYTNRAGVTRTLAYDNRNREILAQWSDGSQKIVKAYDSAGRMTLEDNGVSRLTFAYDNAGRLVSEVQDLYPVVTNGAYDPAPRVVRYDYTPDGQRRTLTYPDGSSVNFTYNPRGQLKNIFAGGSMSPVASYEYDTVGNAIRMPRENSTETSRDFDAENKVTRIVERGTQRSPISALGYAYDEVGNRIARTEASGNVVTRDVYRFDQNYQVTGADYAAPVAANGAVAGPPSGAVRLAYDAVGNRLEVNADGKVSRYAANSLNQYTQVGQFAPKYDKNGNLASMGEWLYRYDALNRLVEATNGANAARIFYDARNRSVARIVNGVVSLNTYDDWNLIEELDGAGRQQARYVHGRRVDEIVVMANRRGIFYPHHDALGNVVMLTNSTGAAVEKYSYSVDGKVAIKGADGKPVQSSLADNRWTFTGREWLKDVGLYDYRNRMYSPDLGRFLQTDPIKFRAGDVNIYRYVGNRYLNFIDPTGLVCGNGTWGDYLIPDGIPGIFDAAPSCTIHDDIYGDGYYDGPSGYYSGYYMVQGMPYTRAEADSIFLNTMVNNNSSILGQTFSYIYYGIVRLFGWLFWGGE